MTRCGDTSHAAAAVMHGLVTALYAAMLIFHGLSVVEHWQRHRLERRGVSLVKGE